MDVMRRVMVVVVALTASLAACSSGSSPSASPTVKPSPAEPAVWLCRPGMPANPCEGNLQTTVVAPDGKRSTQPFRPAADPKIDCFYAYPTVSRATTVNAPLEPAPELVTTARAQASLFASVCRLFVPVYRQLTTHALVSGSFFDPKARALAEASLADAWHDYLAHDNDGRGVVLIGHSQGAMVLTRLIADEIDRDPVVRRRLVSALLLGGQVTTAEGKDTGGDFTVIPACRRPAQTGCVIGYSSFATEPRSTAFFGHAAAGRQALCTDPSQLGGGNGLLHPTLPADRVGGGTGFVAYPGSLSGACHHTPAATWLQVARTPGSQIPEQTEQLGPDWGLHVADVNLALGDLIRAVRLQAAGWKP
jgi:hypothetical protein